MDKRKKYGIVFSIIVLIVVFIVTFMSSIEINTVYEKSGENNYIINSTKNIQPLNYNTNNSDTGDIWLVGIIIISILMYVAFVNIKKKNINKAQIIVLAIIFPIIIFISFLSIMQLLNISTLADAWFLTVITLIIIFIFEYDLFGNRTIITLFDFKLLIKIIIFSIILFLGIGILGEVIPPLTKTTTSPITKEEYENHVSSEKIEYPRPKVRTLTK